jgi:hypothetical protein
MKLRHAAALALVGWYLLVPPVNGAGSIASKAPIKHWTVLHWFGSEKACKEGLGNRDGLTTEMRDSGYTREGERSHGVQAIRAIDAGIQQEAGEP